MAELIAKNVSLGEDGAYTYHNAEGKAVSIEDGVKSFLAVDADYGVCTQVLIFALLQLSSLYRQNAILDVLL